MLAKRAAILILILILPMALAACASSDEGKDTSLTMDDGTAAQPFPQNYHDELLAFMKTYLNNPVGVHDAMMADPALRTVGGRQRYVSCLHYTPRESDGSYQKPRERVIVYVNGRLDRLIEKPGEICSGAAYAAFPDLEKLSR